MISKTIFDIPIYSMPKKEFDRRWNIIKNKMYDNFIAHCHTDKSALEGISYCVHPRDIWKYNQIIGYISVSVSNHSIWFDVYCTQDKKMVVDSKTKHFIVNLGAIGCHFHVNDSMTDEDIRKEILSFLDMIEKDYFHKRFFVDYESFINTINFFNIRKIIDEI
ncbi:MAG: hypothetical protein Q8876_00915 [Bacillota bacterium]|nr:hypothetical protein [Bacillota bacterium]